MLNIIMLGVYMLIHNSDCHISIAILNVVMLSVIVLSVGMLSVLAPFLSDLVWKII